MFDGSHGGACAFSSVSSPPLLDAVSLPRSSLIAAALRHLRSRRTHRNRPQQGVMMPRKVLFIVSNANVIGPHNRRTGIFLSDGAGRGRRDFATNNRRTYE